jgi:hypothetical protein
VNRYIYPLGEEGRFWRKSEHDFHHALDLPLSRYAERMHAPLGELVSTGAPQVRAPQSAREVMHLGITF